MNRKSKGKPFERINLMLDRRQLEKAMAVAIEGGEPVAEVGNRSGFVRWLLNAYIKVSIERMLRELTGKDGVGDKPEK